MTLNPVHSDLRLASQWSWILLGAALAIMLSRLYGLLFTVIPSLTNVDKPECWRGS